jgi:integrase
MNRPRKKDRHLPRCVYHKHGAYWLVRRGKWTKLATDLRGALTAYAQVYETPKGGVAELIQEAFAEMRPKLKPATVKQYALAATKLSKMLAEFSPEQVQPVHAAQIKKAMSKTPNMANRVLSFARQVFDYALEEQRVTSNPFVGIRRHHEAKRGRLLSDAEFAAIYAKAGARTRVILDLLRFGGQRVTDTLRIRRSDLLDEGIRFQQQKTGAKLIVKWTPELRDAVERAKALHGNVTSLTLLHNRRGKAPDYRTVQLQWQKACKAAGIEDAHLHDLRAMAATEAKSQGKNPTALLGHTSEQQTRRYLRGKEEPLVEPASFRRPIDKATK